MPETFTNQNTVIRVQFRNCRETGKIIKKEIDPCLLLYICLIRQVIILSLNNSKESIKQKYITTIICSQKY